MIKHLLVATMLLSTPCFAQDTQPDRIAQLVKNLGDDDYQNREGAHKALEKIGKPALEALRKALEDKDPERASRAAELIERITGKRPASKDEETPDRPVTPDIPDLGPDDLQLPDLEKMLEGFEGSEQLQRILSKMMRQFFDDKSDPGKTNPGGFDFDMSNMQEMFGQMFEGKIPSESQPKAEVLSPIERELGIKTARVPDVLRVHLFIPPGIGLVVTDIDPNGFAAKIGGLRKHDILLRVSTKGVPNYDPKKMTAAQTLGVWRNESIVVFGNKQLELFRNRPGALETIRKGQIQIKVFPAIQPPKPSKGATPPPEEKDF